MSKAPEAIYDIREAREEIERLRRADIGAANEKLRQRVESLERTLRHIKQSAYFMTAHQIETMARDALTKEG